MTSPRSDFQFSIHHCIGKNTNNTNLAQSWVTRNCSSIEPVIHYLTSEGRAFSWGTFTDGHRRRDKVTRVDGIGLDIDNAGDVPYLPWQTAYEDSILGTAWLAYPSPSFKPTQHRYRLLWLLPEPLTTDEGFKGARLLLSQLMDLYPQVDRACKDPHRLWYGTPNSIPLFDNRNAGIIDFAAVQIAHDQWVIDNPKRANDSHALNLNRHIDVDSSEQYCPAFDGFFRRDDLLMEYIMKERLVQPFLGRGSDTYQDARPFLYGCVAWLGAERTHSSIISTGWDWEDYDVTNEIEKIIDDLDHETKQNVVLWNGALKWRVKSDLTRLTWNHVRLFKRGGSLYV